MNGLWLHERINSTMWRAGMYFFPPFSWMTSKHRARRSKTTGKKLLLRSMTIQTILLVGRALRITCYNAWIEVYRQTKTINPWRDSVSRFFVTFEFTPWCIFNKNANIQNSTILIVIASCKTMNAKIWIAWRDKLIVFQVITSPIHDQIILVQTERENNREAPKCTNWGAFCTRERKGYNSISTLATTNLKALYVLAEETWM